MGVGSAEAGAKSNLAAQIEPEFAAVLEPTRKAIRITPRSLRLYPGRSGSCA